MKLWELKEWIEQQPDHFLDLPISCISIDGYDEYCKIIEVERDIYSQSIILIYE